MEMKVATVKEASCQLFRYRIATNKIVSVTHEDCAIAMAIPIEDFENALVSACAKKAKADYIISRDEKFLKDDSPVKVIAPKEFLQMLTVW